MSPAETPSPAEGMSSAETPSPAETASLAEALLSPAGTELLTRVAAARDQGEAALATAARLRREFPAGLVAAATAQDELRVAGQAKFSRALRMLFTRPGLEQASSEAAARHRAARLMEAAPGPANPAADLGCGIGGDLIALAAGREVLAVDRDPDHLLMAAHNTRVYGVTEGLSTRQADVREVNLSGRTTVFVDPARRSPRGAARRRRLRPGASEPPLAWCFALTGQVPNVVIKAAPGLPAGTAPDGWETEFVADGRDLKEAVLWSPALATAPSRATILPAGDTLTPEPGDPVPVRSPGGYLFDPSPAVTRAGLVEDLARRLGAWKIDDHIAFLSADTTDSAHTAETADTADHAQSTPFARTLVIVESAPWNEKHFARRLRELGIGSADLRRRGLAGDVDQIRRRLKLSGPHRATVVLTRVSGRPWGLICTDPVERVKGA